MEQALTYDEVYENYSEKVMHYILSKISSRSDAEDLFSTVFLKVFEKFPSFDQNKASVSTWVYTIARNTLIDYFRVRKVHEELGEEDAVTEDAFAGILEEETLEELASALEKRRRIFVLAPSEAPDVSRLEKNPEKLYRLYRMGMVNTEKRIPAIRRYLGMQDEESGNL